MTYEDYIEMANKGISAGAIHEIHRTKEKAEMYLPFHLRKEPIITCPVCDWGRSFVKNQEGKNESIYQEDLP